MSILCTGTQDNFYRYVNDAWLSDPANVIPGEYSSWGGKTPVSLLMA